VRHAAVVDWLRLSAVVQERCMTVFSAHPRFLITYRASVFWLGVILLSASLLNSDRVRVAQ
jgi:hypothetical protein